MSLQRLAFIALFLIVVSFSSVRADVGDPTLETDHPFYPGEGAFQTPEACVQWATRHATTDHDKALALFNWILTHQWHLHSPQEWNRPGIVPGSQPDDTDMVVYDANRGRFSYGYGLCGTVHAWNEVYWAALGLPARRRAFPGHTNSEVFLDGKWRVFDTDMAGLVFNRDGSVAGYDDIARDLTLIDLPNPSWPRYPFAWPGDFNAMKKGWQQVAKGGHWYPLYAGGYAAHPGVVHLRRGETFTRFYGPDAFGDASKRRFWHQQAGGPSRLWTFANNGVPQHDGDQSNCRGNTTYGNAVFEYRPDLTTEACLEGIVTRENVAFGPEGLRSANTGASFVTFEHFSPYVICGDPVDDKNPRTGVATDGFVVTGESTGLVTLSVSADQGQSWTALPPVEGALNWDLTEHVKGRYGWHVKLAWTGSTVVRELRMATTCQLNQAMYPRLKANGSQVTWRSGRRAVVPVLPRLEDEAATVGRFEVRDQRSSNLDFVGRSSTERLAYRVRGPKPAQAVFRIDSPSPLVGLAAAARFPIRSPSPAGNRFGLSWSLDAGSNWTPLAEKILPEDNEYSSGFIDGRVDWPAPAGSSALVRVELNGGGTSTGLMNVELYGVRQTAAPDAATVTMTWTEGGERREHQFAVPPGAESVTSRVPTGADVLDHSIRIAVP